MRLNSIKLSGFKSFVDPTHLQVDGQLVGVVGPNGCGKSNIIDAVRWVLGESRASELRGESMRDVIFNGTTQRKPAGRASVELVFDNSEGRAFGQWSRYAEIAVKRILGRDGNSTYFINNMPVRRRDIQDIFLGTGLGPRAYAIIGQGMISRIIEARPEDMRIFLEEAAGVSKYKERRRETENRLQDTRENLTRVSDILRELNQNLEKLESQAEVVMKYRGLQEDRDQKQKLLWLLHKQEAQAEQTRLFAEIEQAQIALEGQIAGLRKTETGLEHLRQAHHAAGDKLHQAQGALYQTNAEIGSLEAQIRYVIDSRARLQAQINGYQQQRDQWSQSEGRHKEELDESGVRLEESAMRMELARQKVEEHAAALPLLEQAWRDAQQQHADARAVIMQVRQQIELSSTHHRNASGALSDLAARRERLTQEKSGLQAPDEQELATLKQELEERQALIEEARFQLEMLQGRHPSLEADRLQARASLDQHATAQAQAEARLATLKQLQEKMQAESKVLPWLKKHELDSLPRLWQKLHVETGWETALESVLRERVSALQLSKIDWARAFFSDMPPAKLALFSSSADDGGSSGQVSSVALMNGLVPFHTLLKIKEPELEAVLREWLHNIFVANDPVEALAERGKLPPGGHFVLPQGHMIGRTSVRFYATSSDQEGMLARQQEIEALTQDQQALYEKVREARSALAQAEAALAQCGREIQEAHQRINAQTQGMHGLQIQVVKLTELRDRIQQRGAQIGTVLAEIAEQEAECRRVMEQSEQEFEVLDAKLAELQDNEQGRLDDLAAKEAQLAEARQRLRDAERAEQEAVFAEKALKARIDELQRNIQTAREQAEQLEGNMKQGSLALQGLDDKIAQENLQSLIVQRFTQENELADLRRAVDEVAHQLRQAEEERMQAEFSLQPQRDKIVALQLKEQAARINVEHYDQQLTVAQADENALAEKMKPGLKAPYLQGEVTRLTNAIEALGPVNLAAPGELEQAGERKRFLDSQHADLTEAINTLEDAIRRIDRETRTLLADTFEQVNRNFGELFPALFGGGQARLIMTGEEILDAGVQVMAQPPGKKNATIHLLSGGEKAMTAIALVFAMFQLNPAPFCLLDEVDAPLDDANTERFCGMVRNMSDKTQFVFISHNKIAMEMAQQLVGVTMQEQGVSRIVTVDIESAKEFSAEVI